MAVRWKWDGKTVTLVNDEPVTYAEAQAAPADASQSPEDIRRIQERLMGEALLERAGRATTEKERADFAYQRRVTPEEAKNAPREVKRMWRKQQDQYWKGMKQDNLGNMFDAAAGMQEMLDSGAVWEEEDGGLGSPIPGRGGSRRREAMVRAHDAYVDWMKEQGNTAYSPDIGWYNPELGMPMTRDAFGRQIIRRPDGYWVPAYGTGVINGD